MENNEVSLIHGDQDDERNITWETNHQKIMTFINETVKYWLKPPPTVSEISKGTGLSRKAVYSHMRECSNHPAYKQRKEMFNMLQSEVLMKICTSAISGNVQASRLYLEIQGVIQPVRKTIQNIAGNTNVQINGMVINQQVLQNLNPEQLRKIEEIIKPVVSQLEIGSSEIIPNVTGIEKSKQKVTASEVKK